MANKGLNLFGAYTAKCVHVPPQEEECISSSWDGRSTMYTPGTIAKSQRTPEIKNNHVIAKVRILVEQMIISDI